jgi:methylated-DNA-[protein]-cysteine S-methyltransferase
MTFFTDTFETAFGPFSAAIANDGAVIATAFGTQAALRRRLPAGGDFELVRDPAQLRDGAELVLAYARGTRADFTLAIRPRGTPFQHRVWQALAEIPFGETRSYADLALRLASGPRAVGHANARNPICLIVPCHRVIGADGTLTGFAFGTELKQRLLEHERAFVAAQ